MRDSMKPQTSGAPASNSAPAHTPASASTPAPTQASTMAVNFAGIPMKNPLNTASGTFGQGWQFENFFDVSRLGAITIKGVADKPWPGNDGSRMADVYGGIINSVGLQNPGVEGLVKDNGGYLESLTKRGCPVICQIVGHTIEEYQNALRLFEELAPWAAGYEINISCPNLGDGCAWGAKPETAAGVIKSLRPLTKRPLAVKMAPVNIAETARALEDAGADGLSLINSISGMAIDVQTRRSKIARPTGGLSGPAFHPIALRMVYEAAQATKLPINGVGGVTTGEDAAEFILAGATSVSVGLTSLADPTSPMRILKELESWVISQGATDINSLRGAFEC